MRPDQRWFPTNMTARAAWFRNFAKNFEQIAASLGFAPADVDAVKADNAMLQYLLSAMAAPESYVSALSVFHRNVTLGRNAAEMPALPALLTPAPPPLVATGIFERLERLVRRIRTMPAYTDEAGALLGIIPIKPERLVPEELKPNLKTTAMPGSVIEVRFTRGQTAGVAIWLKQDEDGAWSHAGIFTRSPAILRLTDSNGKPRSVQLRARYMIGNYPAGQNSDTVNVITMP